MKDFNVVSQTIIGDYSVLTLSRKRTLEEYGTVTITCNNSMFSYAPTHNPFIITVKSIDDFVGKNIRFVA